MATRLERLKAAAEALALLTLKDFDRINLPGTPFPEDSAIDELRCRAEQTVQVIDAAKRKGKT